MASVTPRMSMLLAEDYFEDAMGNEDDVEGQGADGRTPLDKTIDRIGMGSYQWTLLALCGFGWLADNMWIQTVAIILPRVQQHFGVSDGQIGYLSSSMFAGMMIGAVGWGSCSDLLGRSTAFNLTLCFTAIFGLAASYAPTFSMLCIALFFLGTSVGGSMPTDGTLLLEHMPKGKQYMVTALSVFFSFGSVISAIVGIIVIPGHSCPPKSQSCDVATMNKGWEYLLMTIGFITLSFFLARIVFFKLHESPRYLVHAGRHEEALVNLQKISRFNGSELSLVLDDVRDHHLDEPVEGEDAPFLARRQERARANVGTIFDADALGDRQSDSEREPLAADIATGGVKPLSSPPDRVHYDSTGSSDVPLDAHTFVTPATEEPPRISSETITPHVPASSGSPQVKEEEELLPEPSSRARPSIVRSSRFSRRSSLYEAKAKVYWALPRRIRKPLWAWSDKISVVLGSEWRTTTLLVWAMWCSMSLAYTMFNVFLPKMLEMNTGGREDEKTLEETMWDVVIFTIGGCPGALIGAYMIESSFGRRWSLAMSTFVTAAFCVAFVFAESSFFVRLSTIGISLSSTTMWAVLYGWTPEIFDTAVRGTATGTASALSRVGGMIAPVLGGALLAISRSLPLYTSVIVFIIAGICTLMLRVEESGGPVTGVAH